MPNQNYNAVFIEQPCDENLMEILEKDTTTIEAQNIKEIRLFNESVGSFIKIEPFTYQKEVDFGEFLNMNNIPILQK